jgi:EmrB/QacA subfamily drug resistance transporter
MVVFSRRPNEAVFLLDGGGPQTSPAGFRRPVALLVAAALFMEYLDATIIATAAPAMARSLHASASSIGIAVTSYLLSVAVFVPLSGWLSARFGSRRVMLAAVVLFSGASVLCAMSGNLAELVALRALQGLGGAMMVPVGQLTVFRTTGTADMYRAVAYITWPALVAPVIAPLLGGVLATYASWRWIFLINVPVGAAVLVAGFWLLDRGTGTRPPDLDLVGFGWTGVGLGLLTWTSASLASGSVSWVTAASTGCASLIALVFAVAHLRHVRHPLLAVRVLRIGSMRVAFASGGLFRMAVSAVPFLLPLMFQEAWGWSAVRAGSITLWVFVGNLAIKAVTTPMLRRWGFRAVLRGSTTVLTATIAAIAFVTPQTPTWLLIALITASGAARSVGFTCLNTIAYAEVPRSELSAANTVGATIGQLAAGLGVAVAAIGLQAGSALHWSAAHGAGPFRSAFLVVAVVSAIPLIASYRLGADVGDAVRPRQGAGKS